MSGDSGNTITGVVPVESVSLIGGVPCKASSYLHDLGFQGTSSNNGGRKIVQSLTSHVTSSHESITDNMTSSHGSVSSSHGSLTDHPVESEHVSRGSRILHNLNSRLLAPTQAFLAKSRPNSPLHSRNSHTVSNGREGEEKEREKSTHSATLSPPHPSAPSKGLVGNGRQLQKGVSGSGNDKSRSSVDNRGVKPEWDSSGRRRLSVSESIPDNKSNNKTHHGNGPVSSVSSNTDLGSRFLSSKRVTVTSKSGQRERERSPSPSTNNRNREAVPVNGREALTTTEGQKTPKDKLLSGKFFKSSSNSEKSQTHLKSHDVSRSDKSAVSSKGKISKIDRKNRLLSDSSHSDSGGMGLQKQSISANERLISAPDRSTPSPNKLRDGNSFVNSMTSAQGGEGKEGDAQARGGSPGPLSSAMKSWSVPEGKEGNRWICDGENSPVSILELVLSDDVASPANSLDERRHSIGEGNATVTSGLNAQRRGHEEESLSEIPRTPPQFVAGSAHLSNPQPKISLRDSVESLELASLDFIGEVEGMEQDLEYVRHILVVSGFGGERLPPFHSDQLPINPAVFEQLELGIALGGSSGRPNMDVVRRNEERRQRMLLFDAVNEALGRRLAPFIKLPPWVKRERETIRPLPLGKDLLQEVWLEVHDWPVPTSDEVYDILDDAARRDMTRGLEKWGEIGEERAEVVFEMEIMIMQDLLEEVALEFTTAESQSGLGLGLGLALGLGSRELLGRRLSFGSTEKAS